MSDQDEAKPPEKEKTGKKEEELQHEIVGTWVKYEKTKKFEVTFGANGTWIRRHPEKGETKGTYKLKKHNGIVLKEFEPKEFHEYGLLTEYTIIEENGKKLLGVRGFIGGIPKYEKVE